MNFRYNKVQNHPCIAFRKYKHQEWMLEAAAAAAACPQNVLLCNTRRNVRYWKYRVTSSIRCPVEMDVNKMFVHLIQLQRKPEPKEVDVTYGKKVKDIRVKTTKEEWKEREASTTQAAPTRIKIFEGGSVTILAVITLLIPADRKHNK